MTKCVCGRRTNRFNLHCKFRERKGYCKSQEKICQVCSRKVGRVRKIAFFSGPLACMDCRDQFFGDD